MSDEDDVAGPGGSRYDRELIELLNELRVALPGVQILFAFLLPVPFTQRWNDVTQFQKDVFFVTLMAAAVATVLLIAPTAFHRLRFLDLHHHLGRGKDLFRRGQDRGPRRRVVGVAEPRADARAGFDEHLMAMGHRLARGIGRHAHAEFLRLDLFRATDFHCFLPAGPAVLCRIKLYADGAELL